MDDERQGKQTPNVFENDACENSTGLHLSPASPHSASLAQSWTTPLQSAWHVAMENGGGCASAPPSGTVTWSWIGHDPLKFDKTVCCEACVAQHFGACTVQSNAL